MKELSQFASISSLRLQRFSFRFAEQVLNSKFSLKEEIETTLLETIPDITKLSRPSFNELLKNRFVSRGWASQPAVFDDPNDPQAKMDFLKERIGIEVGFGHASFLGIDLLKFQVSSYSALDKIDVGVYVVTTAKFQKFMKSECAQIWEGSLTFEKVRRYLPHFKSAIQVPISVIGDRCVNVCERRYRVFLSLQRLLPGYLRSARPTHSGFLRQCQTLQLCFPRLLEHLVE